MLKKRHLPVITFYGTKKLCYVITWTLIQKWKITGCHQSFVYDSVPLIVTINGAIDLYFWVFCYSWSLSLAEALGAKEHHSMKTCIPGLGLWWQSPKSLEET